MDAISVVLSSFGAAKGQDLLSLQPAACELWATGGISLCLYCAVPMLCLRASQLYKLKQTFSFIDSIWLIFLNLSLCVCVCECVCVPLNACVLCFVGPPLTTAIKHSSVGSGSLESRSF